MRMPDRTCRHEVHDSHGKALAAIVLGTSMTCAALTRDFRSKDHSNTDVCEGAFTSCVVWFAEGMDPFWLALGIHVSSMATHAIFNQHAI